MLIWGPHSENYQFTALSENNRAVKQCKILSCDPRVPITQNWRHWELHRQQRSHSEALSVCDQGPHHPALVSCFSAVFPIGHCCCYWSISCCSYGSWWAQTVPDGETWEMGANFPVWISFILSELKSQRLINWSSNHLEKVERFAKYYQTLERLWWSSQGQSCS